MSKQLELLKRAIYFLEPNDWDDGVQDTCQDLIDEIQELLAQPECLTPRQGLAEYKRGYDAAVRDLKTKIDSVFGLIMDDDDE